MLKLTDGEGRSKAFTEKEIKSNPEKIRNHQVLNVSMPLNKVSWYTVGVHNTPNKMY